MEALRHARQAASVLLYLMNLDGSGVRQLCFDQDLDPHPAVLPTGQVIYSRWDYTGTLHHYLRPLMVMNPDGTLQRAVLGEDGIALTVSASEQTGVELDKIAHRTHLLMSWPGKDFPLSPIPLSDCGKCWAHA